MNTHVMLDLETLGNGPTAAIIAIGAVKFDPNGPTGEIQDKFYVAIDPESSERFGLKIDASTIKWWLQPEQNKAREAWLGDEHLDLPSALEGFDEWYGLEPLRVWGNGAAFDNVIIRNAFKVVGIPVPWSHRDDRDFRTIKNLEVILPIETPDVGVSHHALNDAVWQAHHMQNILACLGIVAR